MKTNRNGSSMYRNIFFVNNVFNFFSSTKNVQVYSKLIFFVKNLIIFVICFFQLFHGNENRKEKAQCHRAVIQDCRTTEFFGRADFRAAKRSTKISVRFRGKNYFFTKKKIFNFGQNFFRTDFSGCPKLKKFKRMGFSGNLVWQF